MTDETPAAADAIDDLVDPVSGELIYAMPGAVPRSLSAPPELADRWFAQVGGQWVAVAEWESESDWFAQADADGTAADLPNPRVLAIASRPASGVLVYRKADGTEAYEGKGLEPEPPLPADTIWNVETHVVHLVRAATADEAQAKANKIITDAGLDVHDDVTPKPFVSDDQDPHPPYDVR